MQLADRNMFVIRTHDYQMLHIMELNRETERSASIQRTDTVVFSLWARLYMSALDASKAFDRVNHNMLIKKLVKLSLVELHGVSFGLLKIGIPN